MEATSDHRIEKLREGDEEVFQGIFNGFLPKLLNFAISYVIDRDEAADIVQNVFVSLWDKRDSLAENTNLNNYLITLTRNQCLNYLRHYKAGKKYQYYRQNIHDELMLNYYALERLTDGRSAYGIRPGLHQPRLDQGSPVKWR